MTKMHKIGGEDCDDGCGEYNDCAGYEGIAVNIMLVVTADDRHKDNGDGEDDDHDDRCHGRMQLMMKGTCNGDS